jgi:fibronectin type 3 domain-containing protein
MESKMKIAGMLALLLIAMLALAGCSGDTQGAPPISPLQAPHSLSATALEGAVKLTWEYTDSEYLTGFRIYRRPDSESEFSFRAQVGEVANFEDDTVLSSIKYYYQISAVGEVNGNGTESPRSVAFPEFGITPLAPPPRPPVPSDLQAEGGDGLVSLTWSLVDPESKVFGFKIYRSVGDEDDFNLTYSTGNSGLRSWNDNEVTNGTLYYYRMTSYGSTGMESLPTSSVFATPSDAEPPPGPDTLMMFVSSNRVHLFWEQSDPLEISGYNLYRQAWDHEGGDIGDAPFVLIGGNISLDRTEWLDETVNGLNEYAFYLAALDYANPPNESTRVVFEDPDGQSFAWPKGDLPPLPPYNLTWADSRDNRIDVSVSWVYSPSSADVNGYRVYRSLSPSGPWGDPVAELSNIANTHYEDGLTKYTTYYYAVSAYSNINDESALSLPVRTHPGPPSIPFLGNLSFDGDYIVVDWSASGNNESDLAGFRVYRGFIPGDLIEVYDTMDPTERTWLDSGWFPGQPHYYAISSYDTFGNESALSVEKSVTPSE